MVLNHDGRLTNIVDLGDTNMKRATVLTVILVMSLSAATVWSASQEESTARKVVHITLFDDQVEEK